MLKHGSCEELLVFYAADISSQSVILIKDGDAQQVTFNLFDEYSDTHGLDDGFTQCAYFDRAITLEPVSAYLSSYTSVIPLMTLDFM